MDLMTILGNSIIALVVVAALYLAAAIALIVAAFRLAASQEEIPSSLDCRDAQHVACAGCGCSCHP